jgi:hypothetical protein
MKKKYKIGCISFILLFNPITLLFLWGISTYWSNTHPEVGENVKSVDWLPQEAQNISYYKTYSYTAFEFDISEEGFRKWAARWDFKKIETPAGISRYNRMMLKMPKFDSKDADKSMKEYEEYKSKVNAAIVNGYYYRTPPRGDGGGMYVAYDTDKGRAYFQSSPR